MDERVEKWLQGQQRQLEHLLALEGVDPIEAAQGRYDLRLFALIRAMLEWRDARIGQHVSGPQSIKAQKETEARVNAVLKEIARNG